MSLEDGTRRDAAQKRFWRIPELHAKLLTFLDLDSIKNLAEAHEFTRQILGDLETSAWKKLIKRLFSLELGVDTERSMARLLADILSLIQDSPGSQLELDLLHAVCEQHPSAAHYEFVDVSCACGCGCACGYGCACACGCQLRVFVDVSCACLQTHNVSERGFCLLENIQAKLGKREPNILEVDTCIARELEGLLLTALSSMATRQQGMKMKLQPGRFIGIQCTSREDAEAIASLAMSIQAVHVTICVWGSEIGEEGWAAIRRGVEQLADPPAVQRPVFLKSEREAMAGGRREDLKAIFLSDGISSWTVFGDNENFDVPNLEFTKEEDGGVGWEGLEAVINMTEEEWVEKARREGDLVFGSGEDSEEDEDSQSEESETDEGDE